MIRAENLSLSIHGTDILTDVSFQMKPGQVFGLVGESGSGKSMTALALMGLLPRGAETRGRILLDGGDLTRLNDRDMCAIRGNRISMIFQEPMTALNPVRTIGDQVAETLLIHTRATRAEALEIARQKLTRVGLPPERVPLDRFPHELSGGQRQRVCIAMAIRADHRAGRHHTGADPDPAARAGRGRGHVAVADHSRSGGGGRERACRCC